MKKSTVDWHCFAISKMIHNLASKVSDNGVFNWNSNQVLTFAILFGAGLFQTGCATPAGVVESWPITSAEESQFSGKVIDVQCELSGNCADECGQGKRQLAIKSEDKNIGTVLVAKNLSNYSGAAEELWQFCDQQVDLNGLFTEHRGVRFFQVQNIREPGGQWQKATKYLGAWVESSGKSPQQAKNWQDHDERVKDILNRDGRLGLGTQADQDYFK